MAKMELTEEQWQKLGQHLPQDGDFLFSLLPNSDYMLNAVRHGVVLNSRMLVYLLLTERDSLVFTLIAAAGVVPPRGIPTVSMTLCVLYAAKMRRWILSSGMNLKICTGI